MHRKIVQHYSTVNNILLHLPALYLYQEIGLNVVATINSGFPPCAVKNTKLKFLSLLCPDVVSSVIVLILGET